MPPMMAEQVTGLLLPAKGPGHTLVLLVSKVPSVPQSSAPTDPSLA